MIQYRKVMLLIQNMNKIVLIFAIFGITWHSVVGATENPKVAATSYVDGAFDVLDSAKQEKLTSNSVVVSGSGPAITGVSASNGQITVTKGETAVQVKDASTSAVIGSANIWIQ